MRSRLNATIRQDEKKREMSDLIVQKQYPFSTLDRNFDPEKNGPNRDYKYKEHSMNLKRH